MTSRTNAPPRPAPNTSTRTSQPNLRPTTSSQPETVRVHTATPPAPARPAGWTSQPDLIPVPNRSNSDFSLAPVRAQSTPDRIAAQQTVAMDRLGADMRAAMTRPQAERDRAVQGALESYVGALPVGSILPGVTFPGASPATALRDVPGQTAQALLGQLKTSNPTAYYSLVAGAVTAAGAAAYTLGTDRVGTADVINTRLFGDTLRIRLAPEFGPGLSDPGARVRADVGTNVGGGRLTGGLDLNTRSNDASAYLGFERGQWRGRADVTNDGRWSADVAYRPTGQNFEVYGRAQSGTDFGQTHRDDGYSFTVGLRRQF